MRRQPISVMLTLAAACAPQDPPAPVAAAPSEEHPSPAPEPPTPAARADAPPDAGSPSAPEGGARPPGPPPPPAVTVESITVRDEPRAYTLVIPGTYAPTRSYPLVLAFHGDGGGGAAMRGAFPIDTFVGEEALVVYPSGQHGAWDLYSAPAANADLAFVEELVGHLAARFTLDRGRVFAAGFSSGGFLVNQLACRRPALLRGIAALAGGAPAEPNDPAASRWPNGWVRCAGQTEGVAALIVHGTADGVVPFAGGEFAGRYWAYVNDCATERAPVEPSPCEAFTRCPEGKQVTFCAVDALDHRIWGEAARSAWSFFSAL